MGEPPAGAFDLGTSLETWGGRNLEKLTEDGRLLSLELQVNNYLRLYNFFKVYVLGNFFIGFILVIYIPAGVG